MKVNIKQYLPKQIERVYPWIGIGNKRAMNNEGTIVLFGEFGHGMIMFQNPKAELAVQVGKIEESWDMDCFDEFNGELTLTNK